MHNRVQFEGWKRPTDEIRRKAEELLGELESTGLEIILVPARERRHEGHMIRVAASKNALWYQGFCGKYLRAPRRRKSAPDTVIVRRETISALKSIIDGRKPKILVYVDRLLLEIKNYRKSACKSQGYLT